MATCERCVQRLHYIRYLESKIRVLEYRHKLESVLSDESDTSEETSQDTDENKLERRVDTDLDHSNHEVTNSSNRRVIEIEESTLEDVKRIEMNKVRKQTKRKRKH